MKRKDNLGNNRTFSYTKIDLKLGFPVDFCIHSCVIDNYVDSSKKIQTLFKGIFKACMRGNVHSQEGNFVLSKFLFKCFFIPFTILKENFYKGCQQNLNKTCLRVYCISFFEAILILLFCHLYHHHLLQCNVVNATLPKGCQRTAHMTCCSFAAQYR